MKETTIDTASESDLGSPGLLFAYGTLGPADPVAADRAGWVADAVRGRLYDLGAYPILLDWDEPDTEWVAGHIRPVDRLELEGRLDPYEGVGVGLFRRVIVTTRAGREAWVYVYPH